MQAETRGTIVLPSGHLMRSWEHPDAMSLRGDIGVAAGLLFSLVAVIAVLVAWSSPTPAGSDARPSIVPGSTHPVADPHGVRPSLLQTAE